MPVSYIPTTDALLVPWADNFSALITASPGSYGLSAGDAATIAAVTASYDSAYALAIAGGTRGPSNIAAKDAAKANLIFIDRQFATIIQANPAVTDVQKTNLGITVRKTTRTPIPPPSTSPLLSFVAATPLQHTLTFADQLTPNARLKPFGALSMRLRVWVFTPVTPPPPPGPPSPPTLVLNFTKNPIAVNFTTDQIRQVAYYVANWVTRTNLVGPDSTPISQVVI